jgi:hypothetical protein
MKKLLMIIVLGWAMLGCGEDRNAQTPTEPQQQTMPGIGAVYGTVIFLEGDFMPFVHPDYPGGTFTPVVRTIFFFEPTRSEDAVRDGYGSFFSEIHTELLAITQSDSGGHFAIDLPTGLYSVFVWEDNRYYASRSSSSYIAPIEVVEGQINEVQIDIDYLAAY